MIRHDVVYYRPASLAEALEAWREASAVGHDPAYVGGGTEIVTMARESRIRPGALIDLKDLPECAGAGEAGGMLRFGACLTLNACAEQRGFPLLAAAASGVADHTVRNSITLGGNIAGRLPYREAVLPFLVCDAIAEVAAPGAAAREAPLASLWDRRLRLAPGELLVALRVPAASAALRWAHRRRAKDSRVDYPLVTLACVRDRRSLRVAASGVADYPLRLADVDAGAALDAAALLAAAGCRPRADARAAADYRVALLQAALDDAAAALGGPP
jgi:CO/xanthine dehydrogenase FAD-binding subunit